MKAEYEHSHTHKVNCEERSACDPGLSACTSQQFTETQGPSLSISEYYRLILSISALFTAHKMSAYLLRSGSHSLFTPVMTSHHIRLLLSELWALCALSSTR